MGKSKKKNGYQLYMEFIRRSRLASGQDVPREFERLVGFCSDGWQGLSPAEKQKYNDQAKQFNKRISAIKGSSNLINPSDSNLLKFNNLLALEEANRQIVSDMVENNPNWSMKPIVICNFTSYIDPDSCYNLFWQPAEIGLTAMTLVHGVVDNFARIIDPTPVPKGYGIEASVAAEELGLPKIGQVPELGNHEELAITVKNFIEQYTKDGDGAIYVFAFPSDIQMVTGCLKWLFDKTGIQVPFKVLNLSIYGVMASHRLIKGAGKVFDDVCRAPLVGNFIYSSQYPLVRSGVFVCEESVEAACKDVDNYKYYEEQCCIYHMKSGIQSYNCALNVSNRYAFSLLEILTLRGTVEIIPGGHYPEIDNPRVEKARRFKMLKQWGITRMEETMEERKPGREKYFSRSITRARRDSRSVEESGGTMRAQGSEDLGGATSVVETVPEAGTSKRNLPLNPHGGRVEDGNDRHRENLGEARKSPRLSAQMNGGTDDGRAKRKKENHAPEETSRRGMQVCNSTPYTGNRPSFYNRV